MQSEPCVACRVGTETDRALTCLGDVEHSERCVVDRVGSGVAVAVDTHLAGGSSVGAEQDVDALEVEADGVGDDVLGPVNRPGNVACSDP
jgi:hypothetical protein